MPPSNALRDLVRAGAWCAEQERARHTPARRRRERLRREVLATLCDPIMGGGPDHEIAADHGVPADLVRHLRDRLARDRATHAITMRLAELAACVGWRGSLDALLARVLDGALQRAQRRAEARNAAAATPSHARPVSGRSGAQAQRQDVGTRRSADGAKAGRRGPKHAGGTSGIGIRGGDDREASLGPSAQAGGKRARGEGEGATGRTGRVSSSH